jgi:hypothetical protein
MATLTSCKPCDLRLCPILKPKAYEALSFAFLKTTVVLVGLVATGLVATFLSATVGFTGAKGFVCAQLVTVIVVAMAKNIDFFILRIFEFRPQKYIRITLYFQEKLNFAPYFTLFNTNLKEVLTL